MKTTHEKTHSENGEGECWWSRIASPYPDANNVAPPATNDEEEYRTRCFFFVRTYRATLQFFLFCFFVRT